MTFMPSHNLIYIFLALSLAILLILGSNMRFFVVYVVLPGNFSSHIKDITDIVNASFWPHI